MNQLHQINHAKEIGRSLVDHYVELFNPQEYFVLCTYQNILDSIYASLGIDKKESELEILSNFRNGCLTDEYVCVAVAGYQVSLAYNNLVLAKNSYNDVLTEKLHVDHAELQRLYSLYQDDLWERTKHCFSRKDLHLLIPQKRTNAYCYVQYPYSQRIIDNATLTRYRDIFSRIHLAPDSVISFDQFSVRVFDSNDNYQFDSQLTYADPYIYSDTYEKIARKIIFDYYLAWDGENKLIERKKQKSLTTVDKEQLLQKISHVKVHKDQTFQCFDREGNTISVQQVCSDEKVFYSFDYVYSIWTEVFSINNNNSFGKIIETSFFEFLSSNNKLLGEYLLAKYTNSRYSFLVFAENMPKEVYGILQCEVDRRRGCLQFSGGLKNAVGEWLLGALPTVIVKRRYKEVYIDSQRYSILNERLDLNLLDLVPGEHSLKAKDTGRLFFSVAIPCSKRKEIGLGWIYPWQTGPFSSIGNKEPILHGLLFNPLAFSKRNENRKPEGTLSFCLDRNKKLLEKPLVIGIKHHLDRRRRLHEF